MIRLALFVLALMPLPAVAQSLYGCNGIESRMNQPSIEGLDGVFYRIDPDLHDFAAFSDETAAQVGTLSTALSALGTTLIYAPLPTKSLAMPEHLSPEATDYGFDASIAATDYGKIVERLTKAGTLTADIRAAMHVATSEPLSFYQTDSRMTAAGARRAAKAIADVIATTPDFTKLPKARFDSHPAGAVTLASPLHDALQQRCLTPLPPVQADSFQTSRASASTNASANTIFAASGNAPRIALVGTEYSGEVSANFAGFLSEFTGLDVVQYAVPDGGSYAAISSYLTSQAFQDARPTYLVWANPVFENLAQFGDQPMAELIAAAGGNCRIQLNLLASPQANTVVADLSALDRGQPYTLFLDAGGAAGYQAQFSFLNAAGLIRTKSVVRNPGQVATGRFYMPTSGLWPEGAQSVEIALDVPVGANPRVSACFQ